MHPWSRLSCVVLMAFAIPAAAVGCSIATTVDGLTGGRTDSGSSTYSADASNGEALDAGTNDSATTSLDALPESSTPDTASESSTSSAYYQAVTADSPVSYWRLDDSDGGVAKDEMGAHNGTYLGSPLHVTGAIANDSSSAIRLNLSQYISLGDVFGFANDAPYSIEAWVRPILLDANYRRIFGKEATSGPRDGQLFWLRSTEMAWERYANDLYVDGTNLTTTLALNTFTHLVVTYDGATLTTYVNGVNALSSNKGKALVAASGPFVWGGLPNTGDTNSDFAGDLDELAIYDKALSAVRVEAHHIAGAP